ncbi:GGDEF domain-containing protein [Gigaspora margarita]|uniref:GGDEF domain-containing protein n=1 Tax=Gigaspora margarita TaxID=4874 RepID=A0A8H4EI81_GIGMA|nr:GGDEF domain-containing protein [Gigaspora margarita]
MNHNDKLMITDFSAAVSRNSKVKPTTIKITDKNVAYVDPKIFDNTNMLKKCSDIYNLGVIFWEISSGRPSFNYIELYRDAWNKDHDERPQIKEVISCLEYIEPHFEYHEHQDTDYIPEVFYGSSEIPIGRKGSNYIVIKDQEINKTHAKIKNHQGKVEIKSYDSKSKIFVNEKLLRSRTSRTLKNKDVIKMGRSTFQYLPAREFKNNIDPRLQIYNNEYFRKSLKEEFKNNKMLCLLFFDLDFFGKINKNYSHAAGNYVLIELSKLIQNKYVRGKDIFARNGGEEFTILLNNSNLKMAHKTAKEIDFLLKIILLFSTKKIIDYT